MMTLNRVMLAGNLTRQPDLRETPSGATVANFGLAMNERYTSRQGEEREDVCFVDVEVWGKQAEMCGQYLSKGNPAFVEGRLRCDRWEDRGTGQTRSRLVVRAERVQFLTPSGRSASGAEARRQAPDDGANPATRTTRSSRGRREPVAAAG